MLDRSLDGAHLGIVPPLWADNLPQVAIELVSCGVPILTSDGGDAAEIARHAAFTFRAGSIEAFHARLLSMEDRLRDLMAHYARKPPALVVAVR